MTPIASPVLHNLELSGDIQHVHDPSLIRAGETTYLFSTGGDLLVRCSPDLQVWSLCAFVFNGFPDWALQIVPELESLWAPDISFFNDRYHLYYSVSSFGSNRSAIGLVTNVTLDPHDPDHEWIDRGMVIESRTGDDWNAIDPNLVLDVQGNAWLAFGSFWSGIKLRRIDVENGLPSESDTTYYALAERPRDGGTPGAVEAPFIVHKDGYYYLFVSFDFCCRGSESTYKVMVGRSETVTGPYVDREGRSMLDGGGTLLLAGSDRWRGPGHNAILLQEGGDKIVYHAYDAERAGIPTLRIGMLDWDDDGWPVAAIPAD